MKTTVTTVKFPNEVLANAYFLADELSTNRSQVIIKGAEWITALGAPAINAITELSKKMQLTEAEFVSCAVLRMIAAHDAQLETYGELKLDTLLDFVKGDSKTSYLYFKDRFVKEYEREILETIIEDEKYGHELDDVQKRIAIKYRHGKTWLESEEYKQEQERQAEHKRILAKHGIIEKPELEPDETITPEELEEWTKE